MRGGLAITLLCVLTMVFGCRKGPSDAVLTDSAVRASRRAYDGAPPVIPHKRTSAACTACHTTAGKSVPGVGIAPANPHLLTGRSAATVHCQQCHTRAIVNTTFVENGFEGLRRDLLRADRVAYGAPPVMPHSTLMRENCLACHSGLAARPEIRCSHPERINCRQCHIAREVAANNIWPTK